VSTEVGTCLSVRRPLVAWMPMLDGRGLAVSAAAFLPEDVARTVLEQLRWPGGPVCPHCRSVGAYRLHSRGASFRPARPGVLKCKACRRQFTVTVGTSFDRSHVSLNKWLLAIAHLCQSGNGLSGAKLDRLLGVSPQTARFLAHRVRHALAASRSRTSRRASPEDLSSHRVSLEHAGGLIFSSAASGASRPSGKTDSKLTDRGRRSATKDGGSPGRVSFEEAVASMLGQAPRRGPADARQRPEGPESTGEDSRSPAWQLEHDGPRRLRGALDPAVGRHFHSARLRNSSRRKETRRAVTT
jgi:transposase-like protein